MKSKMVKYEEHFFDPEEIVRVSPGNTNPFDRLNRGRKSDEGVVVYFRGGSHLYLTKTTPQKFVRWLKTHR